MSAFNTFSSYFIWYVNGNGYSHWIQSMKILLIVLNSSDKWTNEWIFAIENTVSISTGICFVKRSESLCLINRTTFKNENYKKNYNYRLMEYKKEKLLLEKNALSSYRFAFHLKQIHYIPFFFNSLIVICCCESIYL